MLFEWFFKDAPELFSGGDALANLATSISLSYIAGFVFYCSTEIRRRIANIRSTKLIAQRHSNRVISQVRKIFLSVSDKYEIPTDIQLKEYLGKIKLEDVYERELFTFSGQDPQHVRYKYYFNSIALPALERLERDTGNVSHLIESSVVIALDNLFNSEFKSIFSNGMILNVNHCDLSLSGYEKQFLDLAKKAKELESSFQKVYGEAL